MEFFAFAFFYVVFGIVYVAADHENLPIAMWHNDFLHEVIFFGVLWPLGLAEAIFDHVLVPSYIRLKRFLRYMQLI